MKQLDFTELEAKADAIFSDLEGLDLHLIEKRILKEIEQFENNPVLSEQFQKVRDRIQEIENKALVKHGKKMKIQLDKKGLKCSLCSSYESDVDVMVHLSDDHNICNECILLVQEILRKSSD